ncbi:hypothetical protein EDB83DRAFT_2312081 [Lactarius deliciosus]|nr:hypothetical protein EDB83DRAFT_2312081 [Lactarius deliciosus]
MYTLAPHQFLICCVPGQRAMTLCRGALGLSEPTWYIHLPPVSEDKGQYSMPRGGYRYPDRCAFRDHLGAYQSYDLPGELAGIARHGATPGRLVASGVSPASTALALRSHMHSGQPKRVTPFEALAALSRPHVVPISEVISLWDPSAIRRSNSGKVYSDISPQSPLPLQRGVIPSQ